VLPALVLTAGIGSRLDPITRLVAKPAVPVAGRTLVERVLDWLRREGATDLVLNLHHRPRTIAAVVGDGAHLGVRVRYSWEQPLLGSAGGPRRALPLLGAETFLIVNGDTLCDFPLAAMVAAHAETGADVTMALVPNHAPDRYNSVMMDADRRVLGFVKKNDLGGNFRDSGKLPPRSFPWHFIGVQVVRASLFEPLPDGVPAETVAALYKEGLSSRSLTVYGYPADTTFVDVGTPADYLETALKLSGDPDGCIVENGSAVDPSARLTRTLVWPGARVAAGVELEDTIVAGDVSLPRGFSASRAVIVPASVVAESERAQVRDGVGLFAIRY
jgi:NDP-sugar pyrophosphorylase family protein